MKAGLLISIVLLSIVYIVFTYISISHGDWLFSPLLVLGSWGISIGTWYAIRNRTFKLTTFLFELQRIPIFHLILKFRKISVEDHFIGRKDKMSFTTTFLLFIGSWSVSTALAKILLDILSGRDLFSDIQSGSIPTISLLSWIFIPIIGFVQFSLLTLDSSHVRVFLKEKDMVTAASSPFRFLFGGFGAINVLFQLFLPFKDAALIQILLFPMITATPFILITILYVYRSRGMLDEKFSDYLNDHGIRSKEIGLD